MAIRRLLVIALVAFALGGCSKKSSVENSGGASTGSSGNWDSMNWDQGNWS